MKRLLQAIATASMLIGGCNTNSDNPDNKEQEITNEAGTTIRIKDNELTVISLLDTLKLPLPKIDIGDNTSYNDTSIYTKLTEQEENKKEISQTVTIDGIPFIVTVNYKTAKIECPNLEDKIRHKYKKRRYPELLECYIYNRNGKLSKQELDEIQGIYAERLLKKRTQDLEKKLLRDFQIGELSDYNCYSRLKKDIYHAFEEYFYKRPNPLTNQ